MKKPFLGVAYYPEDWDESEIDYDVSMMKKAGIRCIRIAEFAWSEMEPEEGSFSFGWIHRVIDRAAGEGIKTVLGTPTATPPIWLTQKYPDIMVLNAQNVRARHGGRRNGCANHPKYLEYSMRIVEEMGKEFGGDPNVIGWQIDNEINRPSCECDYCKSAFHGYLQAKYGSIDALNRAWNTNVFSQRYTDFDQIPIPTVSWQNPHVRLEYQLFSGDTQSRFVGDQIDILKKYTQAPIGTDTMPTLAVDYESMCQKCDIMQFNHYDQPEALPVERFWFDFIRPQKEQPFWNTETSTCWNGSWRTAQSVKPYGFCRVNSWLPVALGGEANMYWLWRTHHGGHEIMHGALLYPSGRPYPIFDEVCRVADEFDQCSAFLTNTRVQSDVAMHFTGRAWNMFETQCVVDDFSYQKVLYESFYRPVSDCGIRPDLIMAGKALDSYRLLISSLLPTLEEGDLAVRISEWVKEGGVWIAGPMTDFRDACGARYIKAPYGMLEELTGARQAYEIPDRVGATGCQWKSGERFEGSWWYELFESDGDELATVSEGYPTLIGKSPLLRKKVGKGTVYLLGTVPSAEDMKQIIAMAAREAGVSMIAHEGELAIAPREGENVSGMVVLECAGKRGSIDLPEEMTDLLSGKACVGKIDIEPYGVLVLQK